MMDWVPSTSTLRRSGMGYTAWTASRAFGGDRILAPKTGSPIEWPAVGEGHGDFRHGEIVRHIWPELDAGFDNRFAGRPFGRS